MASIRIQYIGSRKDLHKKLVKCIENKIKSGEINKYNPYPNSPSDTNEFFNRVNNLIYDIKNNISRDVPLDEFTWSVDALIRDCYKEVGAKIIE